MGRRKFLHPPVCRDTVYSLTVRNGKKSNIMMQWGITSKTVEADAEKKELERDVEEYWHALATSLYRYPNRIHSVSGTGAGEIKERLTPADRGGTVLHVEDKGDGWFDVWYSSSIVVPTKKG